MARDFFLSWQDMKKVAVLTSGGDSPGMNAAIRAVVRTALYNKIEVIGPLNGYDGLVNNQFIPLESKSVANIIQRGGTFLKSARSEAFRTKEGRSRAVENLKSNGVDGLICIGGDGTYTGAMTLFEEHGIPSVGVPGTIDNDIYGTDYTIGFDTAINTALEAIDRIRDTADSHNRTFFVEVMGRHAGHIALQVALAGGAEAVFVPELLNPSNWIEQLFAEKKRKKSFSMIIVAEGDEEGGAMVLANKVKNKYPEVSPGVTILGHIQRGGSPTAFDRVLATKLGAGAVEALLEGKVNMAIGQKGNEITLTPYADAIKGNKVLPQDLLKLIEIVNS